MGAKQYAEAMTPDQYRTNPSLGRRSRARRGGVICRQDHWRPAPTHRSPLSATCWASQPLAPSGDFVFNAELDAVRAGRHQAPMSVGGMPGRRPLMGQQLEDARMTGIARWMTVDTVGGSPADIFLPPRRRAVVNHSGLTPSATISGTVQVVQVL